MQAKFVSYAVPPTHLRLMHHLIVAHALTNGFQHYTVCPPRSSQQKAQV